LVPVGTSSLRIALNGTAEGLPDFDLYVRRGSPPVASSADCISAEPSQFEYCELTEPLPGTWYLGGAAVRWSGYLPDHCNHGGLATVHRPDCRPVGCGKRAHAERLGLLPGIGDPRVCRDRRGPSGLRPFHPDF